jgi:hypothetical protein
MNKQKEILKWSLALDSTASILTLCVGIYLGVSFLNLICLVPILINLYILKFLINKNLDKMDYENSNKANTDSPIHIENA